MMQRVYLNPAEIVVAYLSEITRIAPVNTKIRSLYHDRLPCTL